MGTFFETQCRTDLSKMLYSIWYLCLPHLSDFVLFYCCHLFDKVRYIYIKFTFGFFLEKY